MLHLKRAKCDVKNTCEGDHLSKFAFGRTYTSHSCLDGSIWNVLELLIVSTGLQSHLGTTGGSCTGKRMSGLLLLFYIYTYAYVCITTMIRESLKMNGGVVNHGQNSSGCCLLKDFMHMQMVVELY